MAHDSLEDLMMEAERLGIREDVFEKVGKMKKKSKNKPTSDIYDDAFSKVKKKLDKKRRTAK